MTMPLSILVVDDHRVFAEGLMAVLQLQFQDASFEAAHSGERAWSRLMGPHSFSLVITDISMSDLDGLELAARIKKEQPALRVLILSMHNEHAIVKAALESEAEGFVLKSASAGEIGQAIRDILDDRTHYSREVMEVFLREIRREKQEVNKPALTDRELEVLKLILEELPSEAIAQKLFISRRTVDTHRANILEKTGCRNLISLYKYAVGNHLV